MSEYYTAQRGLWHGKGAELLGLRGEIEREDFVALVENKMPRSGNPLTVRTREDRIVGWDFTFSVPKSVSLYLAENEDKAVERLIHEAFKETMSDLEASMETRVRGKDENGLQRYENRTTGNMVYASFVHKETRPVKGIPDPDWHIHAFAMNGTFDSEEGRWKAGKVRNLKANAPSTKLRFTRWLRRNWLRTGTVFDGPRRTTSLPV